METIEVLRKARELVAKPGGWTRGIYARNAEGRACSAFDDDATCFCVEGAIIHAQRSFELGAAHRAVANVARVHSASIPEWNDNPLRTQAEAVAVFDAAIAKLQEPAHAG